jgi:fibrillarin-like pre-rRNA processing protein
VQKGGLGFLFVKARSINVSEAPAMIYKEVERRLTEAGLQILRQVDLEPFEQDHRAFVVRVP